MNDRLPLVAHVVYRFDTGGLENGVVNLINHMPEEAYRHVVIALTEITDFKERIKRPDVQFIALNKAPDTSSGYTRSSIACSAAFSPQSFTPATWPRSRPPFPLGLPVCPFASMANMAATLAISTGQTKNTNGFDVFTARS